MFIRLTKCKPSVKSNNNGVLETRRDVLSFVVVTLYAGAVLQGGHTGHYYRLNALRTMRAAEPGDAIALTFPKQNNKCPNPERHKFCLLSERVRCHKQEDYVTKPRLGTSK